MLDNNQLKAVTIGDGPALIVAGPGSGKTRVLTHHIKYLIEELNILPQRILVITFSRAASAEMKSRFQSLIPNSKVNFGTFHSIFYKLLKMYNISVPKICDEEIRKNIIERLVDNDEDVEIVSSKISLFKSRPQNDNDIKTSYISEIVDRYNKYLKNMNFIDYDDILINTYNMLSTKPVIRNEIKALFDYILVDEFQDINEYQYLSLKLIANNNIFAVGDDDQSIYGFRGADGKLMNRLLDDFKDTKKIYLDVNYRSEKDIVRASELVIKDNSNRLKNSSIVSVNHSGNDSLHIIKRLTTKELLDEIYLDVFKYSKEYQSVAVLLRTNKDVSRYRKLLFNDKRAVSAECRKSIIKTYVYYIDYVIHGNINSLMKIINIPLRYIPKNAVCEFNNISEIEKFLSGKRCFEDFSILVRQLNTLKKSVPFSMSVFLENVVGLKQFYKQEYKNLSNEDVDDIFEEIRNLARNTKSLDEFYVLLEADVSKDNSNKNQSNIKIMTFHASKGLEFDAVFIPEVIEGKIPGHGGAEETDIEEERRLFYVAMTRARKELFIYTTKKEENAEALPSRFLNNIYDYSSSNSSSSSHSSNLSKTASNSSSSSIYNSSGSSLGSSGFSKYP